MKTFSSNAVRGIDWSDDTNSDSLVLFWLPQTLYTMPGPKPDFALIFKVPQSDLC